MTDEKKRASKGKKHGPCGECVYFHDEETPKEHVTGRCHGLPPGAFWPVVPRVAAGCSLFEPAD